MPLRVIQACIRFHPAPGGAETHVFEVSAGLIRRGHHVKVFTSDLYTETPFKRIPQSAIQNPKSEIPVRRFRGYTIGGEAHYVLMPAMAAALVRERPDVFHAHSYGYFQTGLGPLIRGLKGVPFVFTPHFHPEWSMWGGEKRRGLRRIYDRTVGRAVLKAADAIVGVSRHEMELLLPAGDPLWARVRLIPNGINIGEFTPPPDGARFRKAFGLEGVPLVLYAGRLASNKGLLDLVKAVPPVLREIPDARFVLAGEDQGMKEILEGECRSLDIGKHILFPGHISREMLLSAFAACDVFVLPSEYEAFGIVLLEAMAALKPVVATRVGGVPEVVEDGKTGILVEYADHSSLAAAILRLLKDDGLRQEMGRRGRARAEERFTWEKVVDALESVYKEVVRG